jgi:hypothetical protein
MNDYQPPEVTFLEELPVTELTVEEPAAKKPRSLFARQVNISQEENTSRPTTTWQQNLEFVSVHVYNLCDVNFSY